jgi:hypothetical protein
VTFIDGSFEGDADNASRVLARREGFVTQAPHVLLKVTRALQAPNDQIEDAVARIETELRAIPEAIDRQSALQLINNKISLQTRIGTGLAV